MRAACAAERAGVDHARLNGGARQALEVAADAQAVPRQLVVGEELRLRLPPGLVVAELDRLAADQLRRRRDQAAVVVHRLAEGKAARHQGVARETRRRREVKPVPVLI